MGKEMNEALAEAGIKRESIMVIHAYACQATEPRRDRDERKATIACRPLVGHLIQNLSVHTPVMLAGKWALLSMTGKEKGLFNTRGFVDAKFTLKDEKEVEDAGGGESDSSDEAV